MDERAFRDDTTVEIEFIIIMSNEKCSSLPICVKFASELFCFFGTSTSAFVGSFNWLSFFLSSVSNIFFLSFSFETAAGRDCSWMQLIYAYKILVSSSPSFLLSLRLFFPTFVGQVLQFLFARSFLFREFAFCFQLREVQIENLWTLNRLQIGLRLDAGNNSRALGAIIHFRRGSLVPANF